MLTAWEIIEEAKYRAKTPGYDVFALRNLNAILSDLCQHHDFALARGVHNFSFNPSLSTMYGSGPYPLPLDYLRTSGSSGATGTSKSAWYLYPTPAFPAGQPIYMVPIDLAELDMLPQFPNQSTPELWATDMGGPVTERIVLSTTCGLASGVTTAAPVSTAGLRTGLGMAGEGIQAGTTIIYTGGPNVTMSLPATATLSAASVFFGIQPNGYAYPPPLGSYPVTIRYQRQMPPLTDVTQTPWFPGDGYLIDELSARLCGISDDQRAAILSARAAGHMQKYLALSDDKTNRAQTVQLDLRNFGGGTAYSRARNTKHQGF